MIVNFLVEIDDAVISHMAWVSRVKLFVHGESSEVLKPSEAYDAASCTFGKWLQHYTEEIPANSFIEISNRHHEFHQAAGQIVDFFSAHGPAKESFQMIEHLDALSRYLIKSLIALKRKNEKN